MSISSTSISTITRGGTDVSSYSVDSDDRSEIIHGVVASHLVEHCLAKGQALLAPIMNPNSLPDLNALLALVKLIQQGETIRNQRGRKMLVLGKGEDVAYLDMESIQRFFRMISIPHSMKLPLIYKLTYYYIDQLICRCDEPDLDCIHRFNGDFQDERERMAASGLIYNYANQITNLIGDQYDPPLSEDERMYLIQKASDEKRISEGGHVFQVCLLSLPIMIKLAIRNHAFIQKAVALFESDPYLCALLPRSLTQLFLSYFRSPAPIEYLPQEWLSPRHLTINVKDSLYMQKGLQKGAALLAPIMTPHSLPDLTTLVAFLKLMQQARKTFLDRKEVREDVVDLGQDTYFKIDQFNFKDIDPKFAKTGEQWERTMESALRLPLIHRLLYWHIGWLHYGISVSHGDPNMKSHPIERLPFNPKIPRSMCCNVGCERMTDLISDQYNPPLSEGEIMTLSKWKSHDHRRSKESRVFQVYELTLSVMMKLAIRHHAFTQKAIALFDSDPYLCALLPKALIQLCLDYVRLPSPQEYLPQEWLSNCQNLTIVE